jgi:hypothetical protein
LLLWRVGRPREDEAADEGVHRHVDAAQRVKASKETCSSTAKQREACDLDCLAGARATLPCFGKSLSAARRIPRKKIRNSYSCMSCQGRLSFPNFIKLCLILMMHANLRPLAVTWCVSFLHVRIVSDGRALGSAGQHLAS